MLHKLTKTWFLIPLLLIIIVIICTWVYPYSYISLTKSVGYSPDPIFLKEYKSRLNQLKEQTSINKNGEITITINDVSNLLSDTYLNEKHNHVKYKELEILLSNVEKLKKDLTVIDDNQLLNLTKNAKIDLNQLISDFESLEDEITAILNSRTHTRFTLKRQIHNLHVSLAKEIDESKMFYSDYIEDK